jgi:hypothetical protein
MFVVGLDSVPLVVERVSRLRDIGRRVHHAPLPDGPSAVAPREPP